MKITGVIEGRIAGRVALRVQSIDPYSAEFTAEQIETLAQVAEHYGSGTVHVTPRQSVEIPDVDEGNLVSVEGLLEGVGLVLGSTGNALRNVTACSRWCLYNAFPMSDLARDLNRRFRGRSFPGKTNISLSGCDFSCVRSRTSDIGVIARSDIEVTDNKCKQCTLCVKEPLGCQVDAITLTAAGVSIDAERCVRCGFCTNVCKPESIRLKSRGFDLYLGGSGGIRPREAFPAGHCGSKEELVETLDGILERYGNLAADGERIGDTIARTGLSAFGC